MELKDIKVGMKVELLSKHGAGDNFDDIEDWFEKYSEREEVQQIKKQGYAIVINICTNNNIQVSDTINGNWWLFLPSDLEPYEETQENKTPKEWLLTTGVIFTTRDNNECVTLGDGTAYMLNGIGLWSDDLEGTYTDNLKYYDDCPINDIMKIEYKGKVVWERKVNYVSFDEAVKSGKRIRNEKWASFYTLQDIIAMWNVYLESTAREEISGLWEIE